MSQRIDNAAVQSHFLTDTVATQAKPEGSWNGRQVSAQSTPMSILADAAEELTFSAQETQEKRMSERKLRDEGSSLERFTTISKLLDELHDLNKSDVERLLTAIKKGLSNAGELKQLLKQLKDPTHQHAALMHAKASLKGEGTEQAQAIIQQVLDELEAQQGPAIRAGYNIAGVDSDGLLGDAAMLRGLYRGTVLNYQSFSQAFDSLVEKYGYKEFPKAIAFLLKALSADMSATSPSSSMAELKTIMDDMYQLEVLSNFYRDTETLLSHLREFCKREVPAEAKDIMSPVLRLKDEKFVQATQITATMPFLISDMPLCDVQFIQGIKDNIRKLPYRLFTDTEKRQNLLDAVQEILDEAIDREDEEME